MDCSTQGLPVHHQLPEFTQTHVHWVGDAIQPSHPLLSVPFCSHLQSFPASGSFPMSQFFASGGQSIGVSALAPILPMNIQDWAPLGWTSWISLQSKGLSRVLSNTTVQTHQFFGAQLSLFLYFSLISIRLSFFLFAVNVSALFCTLTPYSPLGTYDISVILCFFLTAAFFFLASTHDRVKDPRLTPKLLLTTVHLFVPSL